MNILEYRDLDTKKVEKQYKKIKTMLRQDDLYSAEVKKLNPTNYYRAKLDYTNRLLFKMVSYNDEKYALMLEIIHQHSYEKSKFLRGVKVQESKVLQPDEPLSSEKIIYFNTNKPNFHVLNKVISFDDCQEEIYRTSPPILIIGPAGSGKTALTLEKMKQCQGDILYITHSSYLVHNSRELYYANSDYKEDDKNIDFLSYNEFIETIEVPSGQEVNFKNFSRWLNKFSHVKPARDHHKLYEEFKGVISGNSGDSAFLSKEEYLNLGIKQSIYLQEDKETIYELYKKYLNFLKENNFYDINLVSFEYLHKVISKYDFVVIDEIQDFTNIQLLLILKSLKDSAQFILCGDSNQIVHPNFFSWAKIKTLFYTGEIELYNNATRILHTNYRSSSTVINLANSILKVKNARLGSIDRESNYLMDSNSQNTGEVFLLKSSGENVELLNSKTKKSANYAVIVIRDDLKELARKKFDTPLIFSIHEAKGLEYDNIILYDFISAESKAFLEITKGLKPEDLTKELSYSRIKDKSDRSLEIYKFYINALYVAITRAMSNIYWVESVKKHPLLDLLNVEEIQSSIKLDSRESSIEEWQLEARKLELQGKQDQADAIRSQVVEEKTVPWEVLTNDRIEILKKSNLNTATKKEKILLLEYAVVYSEKSLLYALAKSGVQSANNPKKCEALIERKYYTNYTSKNIKHVLTQSEKYGIDFRNIFNQTPLMVATYVGNSELVKVLIKSGANISLVDNSNRNVFQLCLKRAFFDSVYSKKNMEDIYNILSPDSLSIQVDNKLIKIDKRKMEYFLLHSAIILNDKGSMCLGYMNSFVAKDFAEYFQHIPEQILPEYRKKRTYISNILSRNEIDSENPTNKKIFKRVKRGYYVINPNLKIKINGKWVSLEIKKDDNLIKTLMKLTKRFDLDILG
jgi:hypothetical protein